MSSHDVQIFSQFFILVRLFEHAVVGQRDRSISCPICQTTIPNPSRSSWGIPEKPMPQPMPTDHRPSDFPAGLGRCADTKPLVLFDSWQIPVHHREDYTHQHGHIVWEAEIPCPQTFAHAEPSSLFETRLPFFVQYSLLETAAMHHLPPK